MVNRADKTTITAKEREVYSDFLNNFDTNPFTGMLARVTNEAAVGQALKNIVRTMCGERFYDSNKGSQIWGSLFELYDMGLLEVLAMQVKQACQLYEPRAEILGVNMVEGLDANSYSIDIIYTVRKIPDRNYSISISVKRMR